MSPQTWHMVSSINRGFYKTPWLMKTQIVRNTIANVDAQF